MNNMKTKTYFSIVLAIAFFSSTICYSQSNIIPVKEIKPGMKGEGYTVLKGSKVESFPIETIGVQKNSLGPKMDMIIIRLLGDKIKKFGVVSGMSGTPIYIDGKLIGALAYRIGFFGNEAMAGVTPIEYMLKIDKKGRRLSSSPLAAAWCKNLMPIHPLDSFLKREIEEAQSLNISPSTGSQIFKPIDTPLGFSGFHPAVIDSFSNLFSQLGFIACQTAGSTSGIDNIPLEPGSSIAVQLARGDITISATGTVTYIDKDMLLAFGHPFFQIGQIEMPLAKSQVLEIFPSIYSSFKIAESSSEVIGTIVQDRSSGILGLLGRKPQMIPVVIEVKGENQVMNNFKFEMVSDRLLSALILNLSVMNAIYSSEKSVGESTLQVAAKIRIKQKPEITVSNIFSGITATDSLSLYIASLLYYLKNNPFENIEVEKIDLSIDYHDKLKLASIERAWFSKDELRRGENFTLFVLVKPLRGKPILKNLELRIPHSLQPGKINVLVADAATIIEQEKRLFQGKFKPRDLNHLIALINSIRSNDKVYIDFWRPEAGLIVDGQFMPDLPPSLLSVFNDQQTPGNLIRLNYNLLNEQNIKTAYLISGSKKLSLIVKE